MREYLSLGTGKRFDIWLCLARSRVSMNEEDLVERYSRSTEERQADEQPTNLDLETYAVKCAVVMPEGQGEVEGWEE
jgi:hypothetical protein